jgi:uncharacterized protein (TIRG00374 family)
MAATSVEHSNTAGVCVAGPTNTSRRRLSLLLGVGVSIGCLGYILAGLDFAAIRHAFTSADYRTLPVMVVVVSSLLVLNAWRATWMLRPLGQFSIGETFSPLMIGLAMNNVLPARLGELVRIDVFCRKHHTPRAAVLAGVALERVFDVAAVMVFLGIGLVSIPRIDPRVQAAAWWLASLATVAFALAGAFVVWTAQVSAVLDAVLRRLPLPVGFTQWIQRTWRQGADGLGVLRDPRMVVACLLNTVAQWGLAGLQMSLALWAFDVTITPATACLLVAVVALGVTVPSAPGFLGVIQALFLLVINERTVGAVDPAAVFAASVYYHMTQYVLVTVSGLILLGRSGLSLTQVQAEVGKRDAPAVPTQAPLRRAA